jgi:MPBQ/MSBQ methyltransferase
MRGGVVQFAERYATAIFDPRARSLYDGSDFFNVGDWSDGPNGRPSGLGEASRRLVERHLAADTGEEATQASLVLDIGCGLGASTAMLVQHYSNAMVLGINISFDQTVHAAHAARKARFAIMDGIHCIEAAFHFDTREDFFAEARRVLRPGGRAFVSDILFRKGFGNAVPAQNVWTGEPAYRACCRRAGLAVEALSDITTSTLLPFYDHITKAGRRAEAVLQRRVQAAYYFAVLRKHNHR